MPPRPQSPEPTPSVGDARVTGPLAGLAELPVAGLTRRRVGLAIAVLVVAWVAILFARQVGETSDASARAEAARASNAALTTQVEALQRELALIQRQAYVEQQARTYRLGPANEIPFALAADASPLPSDAPGTAATRLGARGQARTPLEAWLDLLFGAGPAPRRG